MYHPLARALTALAALSVTAFASVAQHTFTRADTLRGALRPERTCYDVTHYALDLELHLADSSVSGVVDVTYRQVFTSDTFQLDLAPQLAIREITGPGGDLLGFRREAGAVFIEMPRAKPGSLQRVRVDYAGKPTAAANPPWDGGFTWSRDSLGRPFIGVSCEGIGASQWWPNKDHLGDEPDSARISVTVPNPLRVIANGQFRGSQVLAKARTRYTYAVTHPINNYNITFYAGHYLEFADTLRSPARQEPLHLRYAVLDYNLDRARRHFRQVKPMLRCFEDYLGPYPFWRDGYRLVEAPYLGMEHQSGIAYGNNYMRGYRGGMIPPDMNWDYLIVHESGHEYFGNALSVSDHAEMWLHESLTTYLEALYVECRFGHADYDRYLLGQRSFIQNERPITGPPGVNFEEFGGSDHYFKGSWVLHTFRSLVGDDSFLDFLHAFYGDNVNEMVSTSDWMQAVIETFGPTYEVFWRQYLTQAQLPRLVARPSGTPGHALVYFESVVPGFSVSLPFGKTRYDVADATQPPTELPVAALEQFVATDFLFDYDVEGLR